MPKPAHIRQRRSSDDDDDNSQPGNEDSNGQNSNDGSESGYGTAIDLVCWSLCLILLFRISIEDLKLLQKLRQRKKGLSAEELALGKQTNPLFGSKKTDVCNTYLTNQ